MPLMCLLCQVLFKKKRLQCTTKTSQFACPDHASCFRTSSMSLVQRQRRCDGRMYGVETLEQREDGGWWNEDADARPSGVNPCSLGVTPSP